MKRSNDPLAHRPRGRFPRVSGAVLGAAALGALLAALTLSCAEEPLTPVARLAVTPAEVALGYPASAVLSAEWEMTAPLAGSSDPGARPGEPAGGAWVFAHLLDAEGALVRTFDHPLPFAWSPGETRSAPIELWQSALAPPLPPGDYRLTVGLYDPASGRRWALATGVMETDREEYPVARVRVLPPEPTAVEFAGSWWPAEEGGDRQVVGRRWLREEGTIELGGLAPGSVLALGLRIPAAGSGERLVLAPGAEAARVGISSPCADGEVEIADAGYHLVTLDLQPPADGRCVVRLEPSYVVVSLESLRSRSVAVERLSYTWPP